MNKLMFSLASAMSLCAASAFLPAIADVSETTTTVTGPAISAPHVVDSWMQPSVTRSKTVTASDGTTEKTVEPLIMERHEQVLVPTESKVTTSTTVAPARVTEVTTTASTPIVVQKKATTREHRVAHFFHRAPKHHTVSVQQSSQTKTVVVEPQVIQQKQTIEEKSVLIERPDPALKMP